MQTKEKYKLLRKILQALALPAEAADDLVQRVAELLTTEKKSPLEGFPYKLRDDFLSPAEFSFYHILQQAAGDWALVLSGGQALACPKSKDPARALTCKKPGPAWRLAGPACREDGVIQL